MKKLFLAAFCTCLLWNCSSHKKEDHQIIEVKKTTSAPKVDGKATDDFWNRASWRTLDQNWLGSAYSHKDFSGRYKLGWDGDALYILVEIMDDVLFDQYEDPLERWWDDDGIVVFVDADNSGGQHEFNHNAFGYHIALDGAVVDYGRDQKPHLYNDHLTTKRITTGNTSIWEMAVKVYGESFQEGSQMDPEKLTAGKKVGFALAYNDNDGSKERENFIGSVYVQGEDKNQGSFNAGIFGTLLLMD
jgi:hypothetical protein